MVIALQDAGLGVPMHHLTLNHFKSPKENEIKSMHAWKCLIHSTDEPLRKLI